MNYIVNLITLIILAVSFPCSTIVRQSREVKKRGCRNEMTVWMSCILLRSKKSWVWLRIETRVSNLYARKLCKLTSLSFFPIPPPPPVFTDAAFMLESNNWRLYEQFHKKQILNNIGIDTYFVLWQHFNYVLISLHIVSLSSPLPTSPK